MSGDKILVQIRLPRDLVRKLDHWAVDEDLYRAHAVERLLREALKGYVYPPEAER